MNEAIDRIYADILIVKGVQVDCNDPVVIAIPI